ncbi:hypothetical protein CC86DRAFT_157692 [Ophiobolus disseminans]|uniref:Btz domain-containing protein n=1 Tax=Ophiobolus disseminans TaxID=1469910 RepID=A0A6A6ZBH0_9PLEO|nr:hypothetical protein CC86DRAFT_157692 [Ophiobolus disseminans]
MYQDTDTCPTPREGHSDEWAGQLVTDNTGSSYWDKFRERHETSDAAPHRDYPTPRADNQYVADHSGDYAMDESGYEVRQLSHYNRDEIGDEDHLAPADSGRTRHSTFRNKPPPRKLNDSSESKTRDETKRSPDHCSSERRERIKIKPGGVRMGRSGFSTTDQRRLSLSSHGEQQIDFADLEGLYDTPQPLVAVSEAPQADYADLKGLYGSPSPEGRDNYRPDNASREGGTDSYRPGRRGGRGNRGDYKRRPTDDRQQRRNSMASSEDREGSDLPFHSGPAARGEDSNRGSSKRTTDSSSVSPAAAGFLHPDRVRLMSPEYELSTPWRTDLNPQRRKNKKEANAAKEEQVRTHSNRSDDVDTPAQQEHSKSTTPSQQRESLSEQVPFDGASRRLSADDGHQWVFENNIRGRGRGRGRGRRGKVGQRGGRGRGRGQSDWHRSSDTPTPRSPRPFDRVGRED